jgi:AcrR family transcriptional regulator
LSVSAETGEQSSRDRILEAAGPVFAELGYEAATIRELCGRAGVNVAAISYYFGDKAGLYRAVLRRMVEDRDREFPLHPEAVAVDRTPRAGLIEFVRRLVERSVACERETWQSKLLMRELQSPTPFGARDLVELAFRPQFAALESILRQLVPDGAPMVAVHRLAMSVFGQVFWYRIAKDGAQRLVPASEYQELVDPRGLAQHIARQVLAAIDDRSYWEAASDSSVEAIGLSPDGSDGKAEPVNQAASIAILDAWQRGAG